MNRIKCLRASRGLSQKAFGEIFHVDQTAVSNWENEKNNIDVKILEQIAEFCSVPIEFVIGKSFKIQIPTSEWSDDKLEEYNACKEYKDLLLFKYGKGVFTSHNEEKEKSPLESELSEEIVVYHRDGKNVVKRFTPEQIRAIHAFLEAMPGETKEEK